MRRELIRRQFQTACLVAPAMPSVAMSLDKIASSGSGSGSDDGAFFPTNQPAADCSGNAAHNRAFSSTVVVSSVTPLGKAHAAKNSKQQDHAQDCGYYAFFQDRTYHCRTFLSANSLSRTLGAILIPCWNQYLTRALDILLAR
jgi:hypothetical protein